MQAALDDLRVIDISTTFAGAWCTRMLADFGADVLVVEPPEGHAIRRLGPFTTDGKSIPAEHLLVNKRSTVLDPETERSHLLDLVTTADIVVSSDTPSTLREKQLTYTDLDTGKLVMTHVTPHGMSGPLAEVPGNDLTVAARSGWASINGMADREPLKPSGGQVSYCAGSVAYAATLAAIHHRDKSGGRGQEVDVSALDVMVSTFAPALLRSLFAGEAWRRRDTVDITTGPVPVADGHFALTISRAHFWREAMTVLGLSDLAEDERWGDGWYRLQNKDQYVDRVGEAMFAWDRMDLFSELAVRRVIAGPVLSIEELRANDHLAERGYWQELEGATVPGAPFAMSKTPATLRNAAPSIEDGVRTS